MKKLLALVLCVMMFVSVLPTSVFAGGSDVDNSLYNAAQYNKQIKNMVKNSRKNIETAYKALVADEVVYSSAKGMDDAIVALVDGIANPLIEKDKFTKAKADAVKDSLRSYFDRTVAKKLNDNMYKALDKDGKIDDLKYAQLIANSISDAMTDKDFIAGYRAVATYWALASIMNDVHDNLKDTRDKFVDSVDAKFSADFAAKYTNLVDEYIDTFDTAAAKVMYNLAATAALDALMLPGDQAHDAAVRAAKTTYDTDKTNAENTRTAATNANETAMTNAEVAYKTAEINYKTVMNDPTSTAAQKAAAATAWSTAQTTYYGVVSSYNTEKNRIATQYTDMMKAANNAYDSAIMQADGNLEIAEIQADAAWTAAGWEYETINPWAYGDGMLYPPVGSPWN